MNMGALFGGRGAPQADPNQKKSDTQEQIIISSLALLKMLKHGNQQLTGKEGLGCL